MTTSTRLSNANTSRLNRERKGLDGWRPADTPLSEEQATRYKDRETIIERNFKAFCEVGQALIDIRDERLYREEYATFEDYVSQRWGMKHSQAYRLIDASKVMKSLSPIGEDDPVPLNEAQARELGKIAPALRPVALKVASDASGGNLTASYIKSAVNVVQMAAITGAIEDGEGNDIPLSIAQQGHVTAAVVEDVAERRERQREHINRKAPAKVWSDTASFSRRTIDGEYVLVMHPDTFPTLEDGKTYRVVVYETGDNS
jgi:hypothetical protein